MNSSATHTERILDQFSKQAAYFAKLPGHAEATQLLVELAGVKANTEVLDVACGAGAVACHAAHIAKQVTGIDLTPEMIERARGLQAEQNLANLSWQIGDVAQLPFPPNVFDVVFTRYSFHHFLRPDRVLAEMFRVCRPGGRIVVADLVLPKEKIAAYDRMEVLRDPSHVHVLAEHELQQLLLNAGLIRIERAGYLFELSLELLLAASFPKDGDVEGIRAVFEADIGVDSLGIGVHRMGQEIRCAYPIVIVAGTKPGL
jgi:ubiquinone/menaquinone biosynthesis C-methylase UbiE